MEHIALEILDLSGTGSKYAYLEPDTSITVTVTSEIFGQGNLWTYSFALNIPANTHIFGNADDLHGTRLHEVIHKRRARLWLDNIPLHYGYLKLDDEADVDGDGNIDVKLDSGRLSFEQMIEGGKANQVPMLGDVQFGVALWRKRWVNHGLKLKAYGVMQTSESSEPGSVSEYGEDIISFIGNGDDTPVQQYPRMVFPRGTFHDDTVTVGSDERYLDFLNTDFPYDDGHPYCNVALCYQRYGYTKKDKNGETYEDYGNEPEAQRGYEVMPANRVNSAPCFFVLYWLKALFKHLDITIDENQLLNIEDMRRLFFVNTNCAYVEPDYLRYDNITERFGRYQFGHRRYIAERISQKETVNVEESDLKVTDFTITSQSSSQAVGGAAPDIPDIRRLIVKIDGKIPEYDTTVKDRYKVQNGYLHKAIATSECFPDVDIKDVISMLENAFGVRFLFDENYQHVRIVLLRNILSDERVQQIDCDVLSTTKRENNIRGFRMTYGETDDTAFYYKGFADKLPHKKELWQDTSDTHDYSQWNLNADYANIIQKISAFDITCYVTPDNGNAYGIKIDKNAKRYDELYPSLFEFAGYMDAEDGDCSGDKETIEEINVGFTPAIMNDVNFEQERGGESGQQFAIFVDETMRPRRAALSDAAGTQDYNDPDTIYDVDELYEHDNLKSGGIVKPGEFFITSDMYTVKNGLQAHLRYISYPYYFDYDVTFNVEGHINEGYRLYLQDNFEPNDDGIAPIEKHDWGLTLGIMRGSGSDAYISYTPDGDDGEGNDTWELKPGSSVTAHPDTCDSYGNLWDYTPNGSGNTIDTPSAAIAQIYTEWSDSNFALTGRDASNYLTQYFFMPVPSDDGKVCGLLFAGRTADGYLDLNTIELVNYANRFKHKSIADMYAIDRQRLNILIEVNSSRERGETLLRLQRIAYGGDTTPVTIDNGVGSLYGRFSLKLRAEKPNPYFDPRRAENATTNRRYLQIDNEDLRRRGLCDQFYRRYSYLRRNGRIAERTVNIDLSQLLNIDTTLQAHVGDITGYITKMQYTVHNQTGLGLVKMEILYI